MLYHSAILVGSFLSTKRLCSQPFELFAIYHVVYRTPLEDSECQVSKFNVKCYAYVIDAVFFQEYQ